MHSPFRHRLATHTVIYTSFSRLGKRTEVTTATVSMITMSMTTSNDGEPNLHFAYFGRVLTTFENEFKKEANGKESEWLIDNFGLDQ